MSSQGPQMERMRCYACNREWVGDPTHLICPHSDCRSEFIEVIDEANPPPANFRADHDHDEDDDYDNGDMWAPLGRRNPSAGMHPLGMGGPMGPPGNFGQHGSPFSPPPPNFHTHPLQPANRANPDFSTTEIRRTPNGGSFYFSHSFSYRTPGNGNRMPDTHTQALNNFSSLMQGILGTGTQRAGNNGTRSPPPFRPPPLFMPFPPRNAHDGQHIHDPYPDVMNEFFGNQPGARGPAPPLNGDQQADAALSLLRMMLSGPAGFLNHNGDAATSQQDFDRIMSQLLEQAQQGGGEPPANPDDVEAIPKVKVDADWLRDQEHKECTICMEEATLDDELSSLWCGHWYHPFCIKTWLDAHGACPLCRKTLRQSREEAEAKAEKDARSSKRDRRRSSRPHAEASGAQERRGYHEDGGGGASRRGGDTPSSSGGGGGGGFFSNLFSRSSR